MQLCLGTSQAQLHDNIWLFGYESYNNVDGWGGSVMDFSNDTLNIYYEYRDMNLDVTNASICDTAGNLLFYTNGIYIANLEHDTMQNGAGINPGEFADDHQIYGYILDQGAMTIAFPESDSLYYLFHTPRDYPDNTVGHHSPLLYYTLIDISQNNGLGTVIEKNQIIVSDILDSGKITATKHANGRDWWIALKQYDTNGFYKILVTPEEIILHEIDEVGEAFPHGLGQAVFSPDGNKYVLYNLVDINEGNYLNIYDFDRCTGLFSNPVQSILIDSAWSGGVAISPNSQFLYVSSYNYIYQYDLNADDILTSKDTVAIYDGFEMEVTPTIGLPTRFFLMQLGPDGRIYINCPASVNLLHVINNPNEAGDACDVQQHSIELPTLNLFSMPNFPNYRLGPLAPDACDSTNTLTTNLVKESQLKMFPNPAYENVTMELEKFDLISGRINWEIYSSRGELIKSGIFNSKKLNISVLPYPNGVYFVKVIIEDGIFITKRMVVQK